MQTKILTQNPSDIQKAAEIIRSGGLVVFPTETVYGLGANALNEIAIKKVYFAKGRPSDNPLIVHITDLDTLTELTGLVPPLAEKLIKAFWPGPLTLVLAKSSLVPSVTSGGLETVAVRMPAHRIAQALIKAAGVPIAAPSANLSGKPSSTQFQHVIEDLDGRVDAIIDGGETLHGLESTVVSFIDDHVVILRLGSITQDDLERVVGASHVRHAKNKNETEHSPGTKYRHYAPKAQIEIITSNNPQDFLNRVHILEAENREVGLLATKEIVQACSEIHFSYDLGGVDNKAHIGQSLYAGLRYFDTVPVEIILVQGFQEEGLGKTIMNRIRKAAGEI